MAKKPNVFSKKKSDSVRSSKSSQSNADQQKQIVRTVSLYDRNLEDLDFIKKEIPNHSYKKGSNSLATRVALRIARKALEAGDFEDHEIEKIISDMV